MLALDTPAIPRVAPQPKRVERPRADAPRPPSERHAQEALGFAPFAVEVAGRLRGALARRPLYFHVFERGARRRSRRRDAARRRRLALVDLARHARDGLLRRGQRRDLLTHGVVRSGGARAAAQAARGDETLDRPCLRQPLQPGASTGGHTAFDRRLSVAPRSMWRRRSGSKQGSDPRRSPLREVSWGWSHASDANETRPPGRALGSKEIDGHRPQRARNAAPRCATRETGTCAQQHARPGATTSQQPSRRAASTQ